MGAPTRTVGPSSRRRRWPSGPSKSDLHFCCFVLSALKINIIPIDALIRFVCILRLAPAPALCLPPSPSSPSGRLTWSGPSAGGRVEIDQVAHGPASISPRRRLSSLQRSTLDLTTSDLTSTRSSTSTAQEQQQQQTWRRTTMVSPGSTATSGSTASPGEPRLPSLPNRPLGRWHGGAAAFEAGYVLNKCAGMQANRT